MLEVLPRVAKHVLVGAGAGEVDEDAACGEFDVCAYLEEFEAEGAAGGFGQLRTFKCDTAKGAHQDVGGRRRSRTTAGSNSTRSTRDKTCPPDRHAPGRPSRQSPTRFPSAPV